MIYASSITLIAKQVWPPTSIGFRPEVARLTCLFSIVRIQIMAIIISINITGDHPMSSFANGEWCWVQSKGKCVNMPTKPKLPDRWHIWIWTINVWNKIGCFIMPWLWTLLIKRIPCATKVTYSIQNVSGNWNFDF